MFSYTYKKTERVIKNFTTMKTPAGDGFIGELYQILKENRAQILPTVFQKTEAEGILHNSLYQAIITMIPKSDGSIRKLYIKIYHEHTCGRL